MRFPKYIDLEFTAMCNLNCGFCFGPVDRPNVKDLEAGFWRETICEIRKRGCEGIVVSGGEPTLYKPLRSLLRYAKDLGLKTVVSTHGRHRAILLNIVEYCDWIALPVDAQSSLAINELRGDSWGLTQAIDTGSELLNANPNLKLKLGTVVTKTNLNEVIHLGKELMTTKKQPFSTWKLYQYTPRRKHINLKEIYLIGDEEFFALERKLKSIRYEGKPNIVFSSIDSRRWAYMFVYPTGEVAIPNVGSELTDASLGNLITDGFDVFDRFQEFKFDNNEKNYSTTYRDGR